MKTNITSETYWNAIKPSNIFQEDSCKKELKRYLKIYLYKFNEKYRFITLKVFNFPGRINERYQAKVLQVKLQKIMDREF